MRKVLSLLLLLALAGAGPARADLWSHSSGQGSGAGANGCNTTGSSGIIGLQAKVSTGSGMYHPTTGTGCVLVITCGGGGGGSGTTGADGRIGTAGGGAGCSAKLFTSRFAGGQYINGTGGTGGISGDNAGLVGGDSSFKSITGSGGGAGTIPAANGATTGDRYGHSAAGGAASGGDINVHGVPSLAGFSQAFASQWGPQPGGAMMGGACVAQFNSSNNTTVSGCASVDGSTGGGAPITKGTGSSTAGQDGHGGITLFLEFP